MERHTNRKENTAKLGNAYRVSLCRFDGLDE